MMNVEDEQLSALVDGELPDREVGRVLDRLRGNAELAERWGRYHLIGDVLRNSSTKPRPEGLHIRIRQALEQEPALLAPRVRIPAIRPFMKQATGFAIAASVTAVAILGFQQLNGDSSTAITGMAAAESPAVSRESVLIAERPGQRQVRELDPYLDPYLVNHNEYSAAGSIQGVLPYVRIVSHGTSE